MNPDEFFWKHPSLKGFGETNGWKVEDEFAESISIEDVARTQTDNATIKEIIDDLHCCTGCMDFSCAVETTKKAFIELLKNKDVPRVVRVDDLKRAMDNVGDKIGFYLNPADASNTCWYYAVLEELGLGDEE